MATKKLPKFRSREAEARFWDSHSLADYIGQMKDVTELFTFAPELVHKIQERSKKKMISLRLAGWEIERSKQIAKAKHIPYQALLRVWIDEGLRRETRHDLA